MTQAGKAVIDQQERTEGEVSGDDLGAIGPRLRAHLLTTRKRAMVLPVAAVCSLGAAPPGIDEY